MSAAGEHANVRSWRKTDLGHQVGELHLQRMGQPIKDGEGGVPNPPLNARDIGPMDSRVEGQLFLRPARELTQSFHISSDSAAHVHWVIDAA